MLCGDKEDVECSKLYGKLETAGV